MSKFVSINDNAYEKISASDIANCFGDSIALIAIDEFLADHWSKTAGVRVSWRPQIPGWSDLSNFLARKFTGRGINPNDLRQDITNRANIFTQGMFQNGLPPQPSNNLELQGTQFMGSLMGAHPQNEDVPRLLSKNFYSALAQPLVPSTGNPVQDYINNPMKAHVESFERMMGSGGHEIDPITTKFMSKIPLLKNLVENVNPDLMSTPMNGLSKQVSTNSNNGAITWETATFKDYLNLCSGMVDLNNYSIVDPASFHARVSQMANTVFQTVGTRSKNALYARSIRNMIVGGLAILGGLTAHNLTTMGGEELNSNSPRILGLDQLSNKADDSLPNSDNPNAYHPNPIPGTSTPGVPGGYGSGIGTMPRSLNPYAPPNGADPSGLTGPADNQDYRTMTQDIYNLNPGIPKRRSQSVDVRAVEAQLQPSAPAASAPQLMDFGQLIDVIISVLTPSGGNDPVAQQKVNALIEQQSAAADQAEQAMRQQMLNQYSGASNANNQQPY